MRLLLLTYAAAFWLLGAMGAFAQAEPSASEAFTSLEDPVAQVPRNLLADLRGSKQDQALLKTTDVLREKVEGREITLKGAVETLEKMRPAARQTGDRYRLRLADEPFKVAGTAFTPLVWITLSSDENGKVAQLKRGAKVILTGKIQQVSVQRGTPLRLRMSILDAKLK